MVGESPSIWVYERRTKEPIKLQYKALWFIALPRKKKKNDPGAINLLSGVNLHEGLSESGAAGEVKPPSGKRKLRRIKHSFASDKQSSKTRKD